MDGFVNEIKVKAASTAVNVKVDYRRALLTMIFFLPYVFAMGLGFSGRIAKYAVAALIVGFGDGLHGRSRDKPKG